MQECNTLTSAIDACIESRRFAFCHLHREQRPLDMHIHDCFEIYYTISGGLQFLIEDRLYEMRPGDLFFVNTYQSHHVLYNETGPLERIVIFIHPDFIRSISTEKTRLDTCFTSLPSKIPSRYHLTESQQRTLLFHMDQLSSTTGFGADILETCRMSELLIFLNNVITQSVNEMPTDDPILSETRMSRYTPQVQEALTYINRHLNENISLGELADHLFLSESYLCRIFKASTGTTISKYIVGRRIAIAKSLLASGFSVSESQERSGFSDYSNFLKAFTRSVGMSPKKYAQITHDPTHSHQRAAGTPLSE